jgi:hypothetical protein
VGGEVEKRKDNKEKTRKSGNREKSDQYSKKGIRK